MRARDVMVRAVVTASPDTKVDGLARLMINLRVSGVPVLDPDGRLVGIVEEGDLLRRAETGTQPAALERTVFIECAGCRLIRQIARQAGGGHYDPRSVQRRGNGNARRNRRPDGSEKDKADPGRA